MNFLAGGQIATLAASQATANPGNINITAETINAENSVSFNPLVPSGIATYTLGRSDGGELNISTEELTLIDGGLLFSWTQGTGKGGDIILNATDSIAARRVNPSFPIISSGIISLALGQGKGGDIAVSTSELKFSEGAQITSITLIELVGISVANGGTGTAGDVRIDAENIELTGTSLLAPDNITILGSLTFGSADAGNVNISTKTLRVLDAAQV